MAQHIPPSPQKESHPDGWNGIRIGAASGPPKIDDDEGKIGIGEPRCL